MLKRLFDILMALVAIVVLLPFLILISLWVGVSSKGGIFFLQERVGKDNIPFKIIKFRTMVTSADRGGLLTIGGRDPRVTSVGYYLRKYKLVKAINVETDFSVYVPNAFTPNEDEKNELFLPIVRGIKLYHFFVYDRWGHKLFETTDTNSGWDGTLHGEPCKPGVYAWKIKVSGNNGSTKEYAGHVSLLR